MIKPMLCELRPEPFNDPRYLWEIIEEWRIELEICPECGQVRPT